MALRSKTTLKHARSSSFPSISHPIVSQLDEQLSRLTSSSVATSSSLSSFTSRFGDLENLSDYTQDLLQLPHVQQAILTERFVVLSMEQDRSWSLLSKIMISKSETNEFDNVDAALFSLLSHNKASKYEELTNQLREMEVTIEVVEQGLECFFRRLIKTRVSLLNVLNH
ncbi:uncharacterized protein LOC107026508 [Solanum pennellii]|uniref:Uncharacterized protein LOC107026508 n=1 Tax=Solanum pennellii TaxID=28526 RepID=A0ABM1V1Y8_SOLPN|nr:uncharacterized protein LOC107026508 [Solanum pennellii]